MPGRWPNVDRVTWGGDSYHPGLQQVAHFDWIARCMEWEGRRPGERWGKGQRMKNRIHSLLKVLGSHWKIKVEEYQLSLYHTKFLPHFKFCMNVEDVVRVKTEKGRLVRSLAISHGRINLGLNQGIVHGEGRLEQQKIQGRWHCSDICQIEELVGRRTPRLQQGFCLWWL